MCLGLGGQIDIQGNGNRIDSEGCMVWVALEWVVEVKRKREERYKEGSVGRDSFPLYKEILKTVKLLILERDLQVLSQVNQ